MPRFDSDCRRSVSRHRRRRGNFQHMVNRSDCRELTHPRMPLKIKQIASLAPPFRDASFSARGEGREIPRRFCRAAKITRAYDAIMKPNALAFTARQH